MSGPDEERAETDGIERLKQATESVVLAGSEGSGEVRVTLQFDDPEATSGTLRFSMEEWVRDTYDVFRKSYLVAFDELPGVSKSEWISLRHYWEQRATGEDTTTGSP